MRSGLDKLSGISYTPQNPSGSPLRRRKRVEQCRQGKRAPMIEFRPHHSHASPLCLIEHSPTSATKRHRERGCQVDDYARTAGLPANSPQSCISVAVQWIRDNKRCNRASTSRRTQQRFQCHAPANRVRKMQRASIIVAIQEYGRWHDASECLPNSTLTGTHGGVKPNDRHAVPPQWSRLDPIQVVTACLVVQTIPRREETALKDRNDSIVYADERWSGRGPGQGGRHDGQHQRRLVLYFTER